jgi:predicted nuclease with RNAse H fold
VDSTNPEAYQDAKLLLPAEHDQVFRRLLLNLNQFVSLLPLTAATPRTLSENGLAVEQ